MEPVCVCVELACSLRVTGMFPAAAPVSPINPKHAQLDNPGIPDLDPSSRARERSWGAVPDRLCPTAAAAADIIL